MCAVCGQVNCICQKKRKLSQAGNEPKRRKRNPSDENEKLPLPVSFHPAALAKLGTPTFNTLNTPTYERNFRIMSWNIERLGDTGGLGKHNGIRPQDIIEAIAKIIHRANPHICALIEVFTGANGISEVKRILGALSEFSQNSPARWKVAFSQFLSLTA